MSTQNKLLKGLIGTAGALALMVSLTGQAKAEIALAFSALSISNFTVNKGDGTQYDLSDFAAPLILNNSTAGAELNGVTATAGAGTPEDVLLHCVGNCTGIGENAFAEQLTGNTFSRGDAVLSGAIITGLGGPTTATAVHVAETRLQGTAEGDATAEITNSSTFQFVAAFTDTMTFEFNASALIHVLLDADATATLPINGSISFKIQIFQVVGTAQNLLFNWVPDGIGSIGGGTVASNPFNLQQTTQALLPGQEFFFGPIGGLFEATTGFNLIAGNEYILSIQSRVSTDAAAEVPEPATLALMAGGLIFLAFFGLRGRRPEDALGTI